MVEPNNLKDSTSVTMLFNMVRALGCSLWSPLSSPLFWACSDLVCFDCIHLVNLPSVCRLITILDESMTIVLCANFRCLTEVSVEHRCWLCRCWMWIFPAGSWWFTDRKRWVQRAWLIWTGRDSEGWCWRPNRISQMRSLHKNLVCPDVAGCSVVPFWLHHPLTCLLDKKTERGLASVQWYHSDIHHSKCMKTWHLNLKLFKLNWN